MLLVSIIDKYLFILNDNSDSSLFCKESLKDTIKNLEKGWKFASF